MSNQTNSPPPPRGLPILSGPPPIVESSSCRQCGKDFNPLWRRSHACGHCGYEYCSNCMSDGQALMPRRANGSSSSSSSSNPFTAIRDELGFGDKKPVVNGYEVESVCLHCLSMLQVTAAPLLILRSLPLKRLKEYLKAYDIECIGPKEKEDFVQAVVKARNPTTGCLTPEAESFYRRKSVPKGNQSGSSNTPQQARPRPPPPTQNYARPSSNYTRPPPPNMNRPPPPSQYRPPPPTQARPPPPQPRPAPRTTPARPPKPAATPTPPPPVPTLLSLVALPQSYLSTLSIGTLKAILYDNHVKVDFKQVLEKGELVKRVSELVTDERKRLERQARDEQLQANGAAAADAKTPSPTPPGEEGDAKAVPTGPMPEVERGLCVVCQDEEATLAVVDCGHLAMCNHCSDLVMATSQECPLCRTRIVTPQRLIRIYRV